jgi:predicted pyridoxine 5'-phosphate oxidase superfamily flavin-nucleotide-binding protein
MPYHDGELEAQRRAGVSELARRVGRIIHPTIDGFAADFLEAQPMLVVASTTKSGAVHASLLTGSRGFAQATGDSTIAIRPSGGHRDLVFADLAESNFFALLAIDFAARRRLRANGRAVVEDGTIVLSTSEVYGNCPQYLASANRFFIATLHPEAGADISHRGGPPGFVRVDGDRISWPDFAGNNMFNTIGNLLVNPRCGLLFVDFDRGGSLQIEGRASVRFEGGREVEVAVERVLGR